MSTSGAGSAWHSPGRSPAFARTASKAATATQWVARAKQAGCSTRHRLSSAAQQSATQQVPASSSSSSTSSSQGGGGSSLGGSENSASWAAGLAQPALVDEVAVQRLVERSCRAAEQQGLRQARARDSAAGRARLLLAAGLGEDDALACLEGGGAVQAGGKQVTGEALQVLRDAGLTPAQAASCHSALPDDAAEAAAAVDWLRSSLQCDGGQLASVVCKAPCLLSYSQQALDARLLWWRRLASTPAQLHTLLRSLRSRPQLLTITTETLEQKIKALSSQLYAAESELHSRLRSNMGILLLDMGATITPRVDFLTRLLVADGSADPQAVPQMRRRLLNNLSVLWKSDDNLTATAATVEELLGSRAAAQQVLQRGMGIFGPGSAAVRSNWDVLLAQLGGDEGAVRRAVLNYPNLLALDVGREVYQQRLRFYHQQCGVAPAHVLNGYLEKSLIALAPRLAWIRRQGAARSGTLLPAVTIAKLSHPDAKCMALCGVALEGYAQFKQGWLAGEEGREWCKFEKGRAAASAAAAAGGGGSGDSSSSSRLVSSGS